MVPNLKGWKINLWEKKVRKKITKVLLHKSLFIFGTSQIFTFYEIFVKMYIYNMLMSEYNFNFAQDCVRLCPSTISLTWAYFTVYIISDRHESCQRGLAVGHYQAKLTMRVKCLSKSCAGPIGPCGRASLCGFEKPRGWQVLFVMPNWWEPISAPHSAGVCLFSCCCHLAR